MLVDELLSRCPDAETSDYFKALLERHESLKVEVRLDAGDGKGKGLFATTDIEESEEIFRELPLVRTTASCCLRNPVIYSLARTHLVHDGAHDGAR